MKITIVVGDSGCESRTFVRTCKALLVRPTTVSAGPGCPRSHLPVTVTDETGSGYGLKATIPGRVWARRLQPILPVV